MKGPNSGTVLKNEAFLCALQGAVMEKKYVNLHDTGSCSSV